MAEQKFVNGINVTRLDETIEAVRSQPDLGKFQFKGHTEWVDGHHAFSHIKNFQAGGQQDTTRRYEFTMHADEPGVLLGANYGPNPTETLIHALCCCVGSALVVNAAMQGVTLEKLEFEVEGDIDVRGFLGISGEVRKGLQSIHIDCKISGDAPQSKLEELVRLGQAYSPVFDMVTNQVPVTVMVQGQAVKASI